MLATLLRSDEAAIDTGHSEYSSAPGKQFGCVLIAAQSILARFKVIGTDLVSWIASAIEVVFAALSCVICSFLKQTSQLRPPQSSMHTKVLCMSSITVKCVRHSLHKKELTMEAGRGSVLC